MATLSQVLSQAPLSLLAVFLNDLTGRSFTALGEVLVENNVVIKQPHIRKKLIPEIVQSVSMEQREQLRSRLKKTYVAHALNVDSVINESNSPLEKTHFTWFLYPDEDPRIEARPSWLLDPDTLPEWVVDPDEVAADCVFDNIGVIVDEKIETELKSSYKSMTLVIECFKPDRVTELQ